MKHKILFLLFLSVTIMVHGQDWFSASIIDGDEDINVINSAVKSDGSTVVLGTFSGTIGAESGPSVTSYGGRDYYLANFTLDGEVTWIENAGSTGNDYVLGGVCTCADDNLYMLGAYRNIIKFTDEDSLESSGGFDTFLAKYDPDGNFLWAKNLGESANNERPSTLKADLSGNLIISGFFSDSIQFDAGLTIYNEDATDDYYYGNFDAITGDRIWVRQLKGSGGVNSGRIFGVAAATDGYYLAGQYADSVFIEDDTLVSETAGLFDVNVMKTDLDGNVSWIRTIQGNKSEYVNSVKMDPNGDIYITGWYDSNLGLSVDVNDSEKTTAPGTTRLDDFYLAKYSASGDLQWIRTAGAGETEKMYDIVYYQGEIYSVGTFAGLLNWGGFDPPETEGNADNDFFIGSIDLEGNFLSANSTGGKSGELSLEEGRSVFSIGDTALAAVMTSTTSVLDLNDEIEPIVNSDNSQFVVVGYIGCLPISIDEVIISDVETCYGDSTGSIQILAGIAEPGFGGPYKYSIDDGENYQTSPYFTDLPAGNDYRIKVADSEGCIVRKGSTDEIIEPAELVVIDYTLSDTIVCFGETDAGITINATGGTGAYSISTDSAATFNSTPENLGPGMYYFFIKDANGCMAYVGADSIYENPELTITTLETADIKDKPGTGIWDPGRIVVSGNGGTGNLIFTSDPATADNNGDETFEFLEGEQGTYVITVTDEIGCTANTDQIIIDLISSIAPNAIHEALIYPNPTSGLITVKFQTESPEMVLEVISLNGSIVLSQQVMSTAGEVKEILDLTQLSKGTYLIRAGGKVLSSAVVLH
jgi:hypothetical protein